MPKRNPTDKPGNVWLPIDKHIEVKQIMLQREARTGKKQSKEEVMLEAALLGIQILKSKEL
jgi:hypothetical protein